MIGIAVLLGGAAVAFALARLLRVPPVPLLLLSGVVMAYTGMLRQALLEEALVLGVAFILFVSGVELNPARTRTQRGAAIRVGLLQFFLLALVGFGVALALRFRMLDAVYIGLAITASSTLIIIRLLRQRRRMFEPYARLVIGVLLLQDLLLIALLPMVSRAPEGIASVLRGLAGVLLLLAVTYAVIRWIAPLLLRIEHEEEILLLSILALLFLYIAAASWLSLPLVVGAFFAGMALSGFPLSAVVRPQLSSIGDFFSAVFFTALGALIRLPTPTQLMQALVLAAVVILLTPPLVAFIAERAGLSARPGIEAGVLLAQTSELSLVFGLYGVLEGQIDQDVFSIIALVTVLTMMLTPFLASDAVVWRLMRIHPTRADPGVVIPESGHVLVLGSGTTGMPLLETLLASGFEVVVVDDDPSVVARLREAEIPVIRGDATDDRVLEQAHARAATLITSTIRRPEDNRRLFEHARGGRILVRVFEEADADWIREMGGEPILYSVATADEMLRWFDTHAEGEGGGGKAVGGERRKLPRERR